MIKIEVKNCCECVFRASARNRDGTFKNICIATRPGPLVGCHLPLPTVLPDEQVPDAVEYGHVPPRPPEWCPLREDVLVVGFGPDSTASIKDSNLWPKDIGKLAKKR